MDQPRTTEIEGRRSVWTTWTTIRRLGVLDALQVVMAARAALVCLAIGAVAFQSKQGRDLLLQLVQDRASGPSPVRQRMLFLAALGLWAVVTWYFQRVRLSYRPLSAGGQRPLLLRVVTGEGPRLLGTAAIAIVASTVHRAAASLPRDGRMQGALADLRGRAADLSSICWIMAVVFFLFVHLRRPLRAWWRNPGGSIDWFDLLLPPPLAPRAEASKDWAVLGAVLALLALAMIPSLLFMFGPSWWPFVFGAPAIFIIAVTVWTGLLSVIGYFSDRLGLPLGLLLFAWILIVGRFNDNHALRTLQETAPPRATVAERFDSWFPAHTPAAARVPVFFVHAEGGGVRAAYWTAAVLSELQDENPGFSRQLFAVSGVSGGSFGAAVFAAARARDQPLRNDCAGGYGPHLCTAKRVLGRDLLSPALAGLLYPDMIQRLFPIALFSDRAVALERSWEAAWQEATGTARMAESLDALWTGDTGWQVPNLFLNSTWAEAGSRVVVSNLVIDAAFEDAGNLSAPVRLSTAAHLSARFPIISPPATVAGSRHLVDGGYYDNSGATTLHEVLGAVRGSLGSHPGWRDRFYPVVIAIHNDVRAPAEAVNWLTDVSIPVLTLYENRSSRADLAERAVRADVVEANGAPAGIVVSDQGAYIPFNLDPASYPVPLGWSLAEPSMQEMDLQVRDGNRCARQAVSVVLRGATGDDVVDRWKRTPHCP
jgi:predicted acylesterase/phospholipase RssA